MRAGTASFRSLSTAISMVVAGAIVVFAPWVSVSVSASASAAAAPTAAPRPEAVPADHRVYMVSDSVGLGAAGVIQRTLPEYQVTLDGTPALFVEQLESKWVRQRMATAPDVFGDIAVVAGGYNYPYWDPARFDRSVDSIIAALEQAGAKHIIWVTLREVKEQFVTPSAWRAVQPYYWYFPTVNEHLRAALGRHADLSLADWAAAADQPGLTYDAIHLNQTGAALYSATIAAVVRNVATQLDAGSTTQVQVAGLRGVPADAKAVAVNLTVTAPAAPGFVTAYACGVDRPATSNLNFAGGQTVAVSAIVNVGADGKVCVFNSQRTQVIVDVQGYFGATSSYRTIAPTRVVDTRAAGGPIHPAVTALVVPVVGVAGVPVDAAAVAVNVTIVDNSIAGYATAAPCDDPPAVPIALVNFIAGTATPNFAIVKPAADGTICVTTNTPASVIVDVFGYFPAGAPVTATTPTRLADTRATQRLAAGTDLVVPVVGVAGAPSAAAAAVLNITSASPADAGFVVAYPCGAPTDASTLNVVKDRAVSNTTIVAPGAGGAVCIHASTEMDVLVDVTGWILDGFTGLTPWRAFDSRAR
ncbi:MAG: hypothetical protein JWL72_1598 [Ilumatobacteraceae bacterium]|nr:hypothetical protein [Ilumatobacteraceae bacterium]MCU1388260.1 hypothetical protein [Ilumatobacteraceae bacterium]